MTFLFTLLLRAGVPLKAARPLAYVIAILGFALLLWGAGTLWLHFHDKGVIEADRTKSNLAAVQAQGRAQEQAADERLHDDRVVDKLEKDLNDATKNLPDTVPTPRRIARACAQLRAQGTDTAAIPECGGPAGRAQASPRPGGARER